MTTAAWPQVQVRTRRSALSVLSPIALTVLRRLGAGARWAGRQIHDFALVVAAFACLNVAAFRIGFVVGFVAAGISCFLFDLYVKNSGTGRG